MSDPITPLTPQELAEQEAESAREGWFHRTAVAFDIMVNVALLRGVPDETISSHSARAAQEGKSWGIAMSKFLNLFQSDHGAKAEAGDLERGEAVEKLEQQYVEKEP